MKQEFLRKAITDNPELSRLIVRYAPTPSCNPVKVSKEDTGYVCDQEFSAKQVLLPWHPFLYEANVYLIPVGIVYYDELYLTAKLGALHEKKALEQYAKLYSNSALKAEGVPLDNKMLQAIPDFLVEEFKDKYYIVNNSYPIDELCLSVLIKYRIILTYHHLRQSFKVLPVVKLATDTIVTLENPDYDGSSIDKGLCIFRLYEL